MAFIWDGIGSIFAADTDAIVNTVNTVGVMGKGLALQFKHRYPDNFQAYTDACRRGDVRIGRVHVYDRQQTGPHRFIVNFPTKQHWRQPSDYRWIRDGLVDLRNMVDSYGIESIAIPALGCGNGGLDWGVVRPLIARIMEPIGDFQVVIYPPEHFDIVGGEHGPATRE